MDEEKNVSFINVQEGITLKSDIEILNGSAVCFDVVNR